MSVNYQEIDPKLIEKLAPFFNLLIITATKVEEDVLHEHLKPLQGQSHILQVSTQKYTYYLGMFGAYPAIHIGCNEMGMSGRSSSIVTTMDAINHWAPKVILMVGIAFGKDKKEQAIGDVLISERVLNYGPRKVGEDKETPRGKEGPASSLLFDRFNRVKGWTHKIEDRIAEKHSGLILSGELLIDNNELKLKLLAENPTAIGGEMEGAGIYAACDQRQIDWILIKGVCDYADGNKKENKDVYQDQAIRSAVSLCELVFSAKFGFQDAGLDVPQEPIPLEKFSRELTQESTGMPAWLHEHISEIKQTLGYENQQEGKA